MTQTSEEYSLYTTSLFKEERTAKELAELIRGHWNAIEIGSHHRRDVTLGEDASRITGKKAAQAMATLRNLVIGLYELQLHRGKTKCKEMTSWQRRLKAAKALQLITRE